MTTAANVSSANGSAAPSARRKRPRCTPVMSLTITSCSGRNDSSGPGPPPTSSTSEPGGSSSSREHVRGHLVPLELVERQLEARVDGAGGHGLGAHVGPGSRRLPTCPPSDMTPCSSSGSPRSHVEAEDVRYRKSYACGARVVVQRHARCRRSRARASAGRSRRSTCPVPLELRPGTCAGLAGVRPGHGACPRASGSRRRTPACRSARSIA